MIMKTRRSKSVVCGSVGSRPRRVDSTDKFKNSLLENSLLLTGRSGFLVCLFSYLGLQLTG